MHLCIKLIKASRISSNVYNKTKNTRERKHTHTHMHMYVLIQTKSIASFLISSRLIPFVLPMLKEKTEKELKINKLQEEERS